jgi:hypothetical protein
MIIPVANIIGIGSVIMSPVVAGICAQQVAFKIGKSGSKTIVKILIIAPSVRRCGVWKVNGILAEIQGAGIAGTLETTGVIGPNAMGNNVAGPVMFRAGNHCV